jgi:hypothetical protein
VVRATGCRARFSCMVPSDEDVKAGYTEVLTAVAVHHAERPRAEVPWAQPGGVDLWPGEIDGMLREIGEWDNRDHDYVVYLVPADEYHPLDEMGIRGLSELGWKDFAATPDEMAKVRAAMSGRDNLPASHENGGSSE